eukprot:TRINITY_DN18717_c0_g1_i1.p1 TRINITY_DN18717_c0_g1~~TRINITY_DN18717_c0_g1_i1.p1  ORF type:complete len:608 (-),score=128.73 TRINITY_DN18717_c0_g1_i1:137-1960(-)
MEAHAKVRVSRAVDEKATEAFAQIERCGWSVMCATVFTPHFAFDVSMDERSLKTDQCADHGVASQETRDELYIVVLQPSEETLVDKIDQILTFLKESEAGNAHHAGDVIPLSQFFGIDPQGVDLVIHEIGHFIELLFSRKHRAIEMLFAKRYLRASEAWEGFKHSLFQTEAMFSIVDYHYIYQCCNRCFKCHAETSKIIKNVEKYDAQSKMQWFEANRILGMIEEFLHNYQGTQESLIFDVNPKHSPHSAYVSAILSDHIPTAIELSQFQARLETVKQLSSKVPKGLRQSDLFESKSKAISVLNWLEKTRLASIPYRYPHPRRVADSYDYLCSLLERLKIEIPPTHVLLLCRTGSYMYDLQVEQSDEDYYIIYTHPTERMISMRPAKRSIEKHVDVESGDKSGIVEYSGYEACFYLENLMKGNPRNVEPLFARSERMDYESPLWMELKQMRSRFITQRTISQYIGFISNRISMIQKKRLPPGKAFCHIFHKLDQLQNILDGREPQVQSCGSQRDFILSLRRGPLEGEKSIDVLMAAVEERIASVQQVRKELPLPDECPTEPLKQWLRLVRLSYFSEACGLPEIERPRESLHSKLPDFSFSFRPADSS